MWFSWVAMTLVVVTVMSDQRILLDSTKESMLDWNKYPHGPTAPTPGWVEESFTNFEKGINWRSYVVCDVGYPNVNNWLWMPIIERGLANRIHIEIKFSLRNCDLFPGTALQCKESFSLLFYEFDDMTMEVTPWEPDSYKLIDRIVANESRFTNNNEVIINTETRSVDISKKAAYFVFRDQGACLSLLAVKVYFKSCPEFSKSLAFYPETPTGASAAAIEKVGGQCVANSLPHSQQPFSFCKSNGTWLYNQGGCHCTADYESDQFGLNCTRSQTSPTTTRNTIVEQTEEEEESITAGHTSAIVGGAIGIILLAILVTVLIKIYRSKNRDNLAKKQVGGDHQTEGNLDYQGLLILS